MSLFFLIILLTFGISLYASSKVKGNYKKYLALETQAGVSGAQVAAQILQAAGIQDVEIRAIDQQLGDHYDPLHKRLVLSRDNYHGTSVAAIGVAAHECGHAIQHKAAYAPLKWRMASVGVTSYANQIVMWLPIIGIVTGLLRGTAALMIMAVAWGVIMLFNLITLPVEFDASRRAKLILDNMGFIRTRQERDGVHKVLSAAALTYVAAFLTSLAYFFYHILPMLLGGRRN